MICSQREEAIMIKLVNTYSVVCDRCCKIFELDGCMVWRDKQFAINNALKSEWKESGDKLYCPDCYEFYTKLFHS